MGNVLIKKKSKNQLPNTFTEILQNINEDNDKMSKNKTKNKK